MKVREIPMHHHNYLKKKQKNKTYRGHHMSNKYANLCYFKVVGFFYLVDRDWRKSTFILEFTCKTEIYPLE